MKSAFRVAFLTAAAICAATAAQADTFNLDQCFLSGGCGGVPNGPFGTVTLTQSGTSVNFDVVLTSGNRFVETGAGGNLLFAFNDTLAGSTITNIVATLNGATINQPPGGLTGLTNQSPIHADGTGDWTAGITCTVGSECNGGSTPTINDLHFTVTNATLAQLEHSFNANGNLFMADILCGQTNCTGLTGPVTAVPGPIFGGGLPGLVAAFGGLIALARSRRRRQNLA
jgi:hypothetical protein